MESKKNCFKKRKLEYLDIDIVDGNNDETKINQLSEKNNNSDNIDLTKENEEEDNDRYYNRKNTSSISRLDSKRKKILMLVRLDEEDEVLRDNIKELNFVREIIEKIIEDEEFIYSKIINIEREIKRRNDLFEK